MGCFGHRLATVLVTITQPPINGSHLTSSAWGASSFQESRSRGRRSHPPACLPPEIPDPLGRTSNGLLLLPLAGRVNSRSKIRDYLLLQHLVITHHIRGSYATLSYDRLDFPIFSTGDPFLFPLSALHQTSARSKGKYRVNVSITCRSLCQSISQ